MIDDNTILQADATVIAGLVLLTISYAVEKLSLKVVVERRLISIVAIVTVIFFTSSAFLIMSGYAVGARYANGIMANSSVTTRPNHTMQNRYWAE